jgi:hypothetical protein
VKAILLAIAALAFSLTTAAADALSSWNDGSAKNMVFQPLLELQVSMKDDCNRSYP